MAAEAVRAGEALRRTSQIAHPPQSDASKHKPNYRTLCSVPLGKRLSSRSQLPQPVKAAGAWSPFVDETTNEPQAVPLVLGDQLAAK
jgi:hypothetical protein